MFFDFKTTPHNLKSKLSLPTSAFSFLLSVDLAKSWLLPLAVQQERRPARQELLPKQANITFPNSKAHFHCIVLVISEMISKRGIYIFSRSKKKAPSQVSTCDPGDFAITKCDTRKRLFPCIWRLIIINLIFLFFCEKKSSSFYQNVPKTTFGTSICGKTIWSVQNLEIQEDPLLNPR